LRRSPTKEWKRAEERREEPTPEPVFMEDGKEFASWVMIGKGEQHTARDGEKGFDVNGDNNKGGTSQGSKNRH